MKASPLTEGERAFAAARIEQAIDDVRELENDICDCCMSPIWHCAYNWLHEDECAALCDALGVDHEAMLDRVRKLIGPLPGYDVDLEG